MPKRPRRKVEFQTLAQIQLMWAEYALEVLSPGDLKRISDPNWPINAQQRRALPPGDKAY